MSTVSNLPEVTNPYPSSGPVRGLLMRLREGLRDDWGEPTGRDLNRYLPFEPVRRRKKRAKGQTRWTCTWCGEATTVRRSWHDECVRWYLAAKGQTVYAGGNFSLLFSQKVGEKRWRQSYAHHNAKARAARGEDIEVPPAPDPVACVECGEPYSEVDHLVALSVAHERRRLGDPRWWIAWTPGNLRPLCHDCHAVKTAADRRELAHMRGLPAGADPSMWAPPALADQGDLFAAPQVADLAPKPDHPVGRRRIACERSGLGAV